MPVARILGVLAFLVRWVLIAIIIILLIILWIRVGVLAFFRGREILIYIRAGVFQFQVWPRRVETPDDEKKKKKKKAKKQDDVKAKKKRKKKKKSDKKEKEKKDFIKPDISMILDAVKSLPGPKALIYTARGIKIKPLKLNIIFGGADDPAEAARLCGDTLAAVWTVMPVLEEWMAIPEPDINISADFDAVDTRLQGEVGAGFRIGRLLCAAIPVIWVILRLLIKLSGTNKRNNNQDKSGTDNPADNQEDNGDGE